MKYSKFFFIISTLLLLQGCAFFAFLGWGAAASMAERPNRQLKYTIDVITNKNEEIIFTGETLCPHHVNQDIHGYYATEKMSSTTQIGNQTWILEGINCDDVINNKEDTDYKLFKVEATHVQVYFVNNIDGNAHIKDKKFNTTIFGTKEPISHDYQSDANGFSGPYVYRKTTLNYTPEVLKSITSPTVIYPGKNLCGRSEENVNSLSLDEEEIKSITWDSKVNAPIIDTIEQGNLTFNQEKGFWQFKPNLDLMSPMEVSAGNIKYVQDGKNIWKIEPGCIKVMYMNNTYVVSEHSEYSRLYVPEENAIYSIEYLWKGTRSNLLNYENNWKSCSGPINKKMSYGKIYLDVIGQYKFQFVKLNTDGSLSCSASMPSR